MPAGGTSNLVENDVISKTVTVRLGARVAVGVSATVCVCVSVTLTVYTLHFNGWCVTSPLQLKAAEVRSNRVNWQSYKQGQMISLEEYGVITRLDFASSDAESRALYLRNNSDLAAKTFYKLIQHIAKDNDTVPSGDD
ncbi:VhaSFD [Bugula neritina]|uniref:VhaSFD n=1 Tax=Bugula neritina TaxID=10212 RepID=A0A7J7K4Q2_BUGNE|nr:VhaSFD [Bugula neritina]